MVTFVQENSLNFNKRFDVSLRTQNYKMDIEEKENIKETVEDNKKYGHKESHLAVPSVVVNDTYKKELIDEYAKYNYALVSATALQNGFILFSFKLK